MELPDLTLSLLKGEASRFANYLSSTPIQGMHRTTDGKAVGTYVEHAFYAYLAERYVFKKGNTASGIDFPDLDVDLKVTSIRQPQSSCPFRNASQKIYGLGYHLIVFVYEKIDQPANETALLKFNFVIFLEKERTADYQTTYGLNEILRRNGNQDDIQAFLVERNLPLDEVGLDRMAQEILRNPPLIGYLTISNALQWRLQYTRVIGFASQGEAGTENLLGA